MGWLAWRHGATKAKAASTTLGDLSGDGPKRSHGPRRIRMFTLARRRNVVSALAVSVLAVLAHHQPRLIVGEVTGTTNGCCRTCYGSARFVWRAYFP